MNNEQYLEYSEGRWVLRRFSYIQKPNGWWVNVVYPDIEIALPKKPNAFRRFMAWAIFGLKWQDKRKGASLSEYSTKVKGNP